jgi:hypothetical protein
MSDDSKKPVSVRIEPAVDTSSDRRPAIQEDVHAESEKGSIADNTFTYLQLPNWLGMDQLGFSLTDLKRKLSSARTSARDTVSSTFISTLEFLQTVDLLKWTEWLTEGAATAYDRSMDRIGEAIRVHGNEHRLFDGGHTIWGSWNAAAKAAAKENDSGYERVSGWAEAYMKDFTTTMGMPFATIEKQTFDQWAEIVSGLLPGIDRRYLYDLLSFDAMEVCASGLSAASVVFALKADDQEKVAEMLGAMGVSSIAAANPILGVLTIVATAYAYRQNQQVNVIAAVKGGGLAAVSAAMFAVLGFPVLVELVIVVTLSTLLKKHVIDNAQLAKWIGQTLNEELKSQAMELLAVRRFIPNFRTT